MEGLNKHVRLYNSCKHVKQNLMLLFWAMGVVLALITIENLEIGSFQAFGLTFAILQT